MSAFWIGLPIGIVLGTFLAFFILLFFMGASERMTKEEWESHYRLDDDHAIRRCRRDDGSNPRHWPPAPNTMPASASTVPSERLDNPTGRPPRAVPPQTLPN
jgi:hypothetical protein